MAKTRGAKAKARPELVIDEAEFTKPERGAAAAPTGRMREYRCLANVAGKASVGETVRLTDAQAAPIRSFLQEL